MARQGESAKVREWRKRLRRFEVAGTSIVRFCRDENVSQPSFFLWRKRLKPEPDTQVDFAPLRIVGGECVRVSLLGGASIDVPGGDERAIHAVIEALLSASPRGGGERC